MIARMKGSTSLRALLSGQVSPDEFVTLAEVQAALGGSDMAAAALCGSLHMFNRDMGRAISTSAMERCPVMRAPKPKGESNEVFVYGPIVDPMWAWLFELFDEPYVTAAVVQERLDEIEGAVHLRVNSPGGNVYEASAIQSALIQREMDNRTKITATVDGIAASAASFLVAGADEVRMAPLSQIMIHAAFLGVFGQSRDLRKAADLLDKVTLQASGIYAKRMDKPAEEIAALLNEGDDIWYTPSEAIEAGLADSELALPAAEEPDDPPKMTADPKPGPRADLPSWSDIALMGATL